MAATNAHEDAGALTDVVKGWLTSHLPTGAIVQVGGGDAVVPPGPGTKVVQVDQLANALEYVAMFDHAVVTGITEQHGDPVAMMRRLHTALKPEAVLLAVLPFGATDAPTRVPFYQGSVRGLVEPLFHISEMAVLDGRIVLVAQRRDQPDGAVALTLSADEIAFRDHERRLAERMRGLAGQIVQAGARYRGAMARVEKSQSELQRVTRELAQLRARVRRLRPIYALPLAAYRRVKSLKTTAQSRLAPTLPALSSANSSPAAKSVSGSAAPAGAASWMDTLRDGFEQWLAAARSAPGDEVVLMFSGTTFVQEARANRPIRLTRVYLERNCPVFFNYYRWSEKDPLPDHPDPLLFQSPIDATPKLLDELITADFGGKKKIFFASFPHEVMVRYLTLAAQHGWVTVYDARDDWEEFAKVGMAKWHHPGYERYIAAHADIVSAVSRPLARKISALAGGREVHVNANALDPKFPRPRGRRDASRTTVGYFGHLTDKWFDWPLVIAAAQRYPEITFEIAGHGAPTLDLPRNIRMLGLLGHQDLAEHSLRWSAALIPFKNSPLADAVDPIKIYEYLHLRLPVLASYFPQCRDYPGTVITEGRDEFLEMLPKVAAMSVAEDEIVSWLAENTWEKRVDTYSAQAGDVRRQGRKGAMALLEDVK
ncbi:glycosyltransferase involved in cell wall biosynthesis [Hamadaea flava]|uniref:Glycosyltransferase n=1 Tax=Hamadaea flava TaxID=1742688 RepID=A0ABV8LWJ4_9ACTN|nr:hypothetical protein [Hamadaea flava]MCP2327379.1 glycosyltransferase involved in cell wall biosynthesis [Hamadaea flava]